MSEMQSLVLKKQDILLQLTMPGFQPWNTSRSSTRGLTPG